MVSSLHTESGSARRTRRNSCVSTLMSSCDSARDGRSLLYCNGLFPTTESVSARRTRRSSCVSTLTSSCDSARAGRSLLYCNVPFPSHRERERQAHKKELVRKYVDEFMRQREGWKELVVL